MITRICKNRMAGGLMLAGLLATMVAGLGTAPALAQASLPAPAQPAMAQAPFAMTYSGRIVVRADRTATEVSTKRFKILAPGAIQPLSQQRVAFIEAQQVSRGSLHQRQIDVQRRVAGRGHRRLQHPAHRLAFQRIRAG